MNASTASIKMVVLFLLAILNIHTAHAWNNNNDDYGQAVSVNEFQGYWVDSMDVIEDLDNYERLWIKPHSCVWSECAVDDTDDGYKGDNRDGDEQWYQYRTQNFCANAAFSLYGQKKGDSFSLGRCNRRHFINSFFTYGGADTLLWSIGQTPVDYISGYNNSECMEIDYEPPAYDYDDSGEEGRERQLSGSQDSFDGYSGTLGCSADGKYNIAAFQSESCDGNYYSGVVDDFRKYNRHMDSVGCHKIYQKNALFGQASTQEVVQLLSNSWSCDLRLYPNGCPDPYGKKAEFDFAIRTIMHGGNPQRAYKQMVRRAPLRLTTWFLLVLTGLIVVATYLIKNEDRVESKGGKSLNGYWKCLVEDMQLVYASFKKRLKEKREKYREKRMSVKEKRERRRRKNKKGGSSKEDALMENSHATEGGYEDVEEQQSKRSGSRKSRKEKKRRKEKRKKSRSSSKGEKMLSDSEIDHSDTEYFDAAEGGKVLIGPPSSSKK